VWVYGAGLDGASRRGLHVVRLEINSGLVRCMLLGCRYAAQINMCGVRGVFRLAEGPSNEKSGIDSDWKFVRQKQRMRIMRVL